MGFWDDVKINMQAAAKETGRKTSQVGELARLKWTISAINRSLSEKYEFIGRRAYRAHRTGESDDALLAMLYDEVSVLCAQRREAEAQIEKIKKSTGLQ